MWILIDTPGLYFALANNTFYRFVFKCVVIHYEDGNDVVILSYSFTLGMIRNRNSRNYYGWLFSIVLDKTSTEIDLNAE